MDAVKFFSERRRMHKFYKSCGDGCPLRDYNCCCIQDFGEAEVKAVEKWSQEHPSKTRQNAFLKRWPETALIDGIISIKPCSLVAAYKLETECRKTFCSDCRRQFWMQEAE